MVLGILSIVMSCCCVGIIGIILGAIGLSMGIKATKLYAENPEIYTEASYKNANAGKICSIIGLAIGTIAVIIIILQWSMYMEFFDSIIDGTFDPSMYY